MKKKLIASVTCLCMLLVMLMSSTLAWFTDSEMSHNTMTVGNVEIKQVEIFDATQKLFPAIIVNKDAEGNLIKDATLDLNGNQYNIWDNSINGEVNKTVYIKNTGDDPAYVRTVFAVEMMWDGTTWVNPLNPDESGKSPVVLNEAHDIYFATTDIVIYRQIVGDGAKATVKYSHTGAETADAAFVIGVARYADPLKPGKTTEPSLLQFYLEEHLDGEFFAAVKQQYEIMVLSQAVQTEGFADASALDTAFGVVDAPHAAEWFTGGMVDVDMPAFGVGTGAGLVDGASAYDIPVYDQYTGEKIGNVTVNSSDLTGSIEDVTVTITQASQMYDGLNVIIGADEKAVTYNINVTGLKEDISDTKVMVKAIDGYNTATVYHYDELLEVVSYNEGEAYVEFETDGFSPFTLVYSNVEQPSMPEGLPVAVVTDEDQYEYTALEWKSFGPVGAADAGQKLYSVYNFTAPHTNDTIEDCAYKGWHCDYYVMVDKPIDAGTIFLGGNYGSFGWVGFTNPEAVDADVAIPLLGSVSESAWTYEDIVSFVGAFKCGVAEAIGHEGALAGVTFTVMLRLTNP